MRAGPLTPALLAAVADQGSFDVDRWTRGVHWANHFRQIEDSLRWQAALDSTRRALTARQLTALPCDTGALHFPTAEAWRAGGQEVRLYTGWVRQRRARTRVRPSFGIIALNLTPDNAPGCGRDVPERHYRLLTPDEIVRRAVDWLTNGGSE